MNKTVIVQRFQTLADIAIQYCGSVEAIYDIALLNDLAITDELQPGSEIQIPDSFDNRVVGYLTDKQIIPFTRIPKEIEEEAGIDFWGVENDFIVS